MALLATRVLLMVRTTTIDCSSGKQGERDAWRRSTDGCFLSERDQRRGPGLARAAAPGLASAAVVAVVCFVGVVGPGHAGRTDDLWGQDRGKNGT